MRKQIFQIYSGLDKIGNIITERDGNYFVLSDWHEL